jgi:[glutamine synthetase] adenylyltransferase / [glutamine synthetase]-adenylyl-L-tyrosine phosphorylase
VIEGLDALIDALGRDPGESPGLDGLAPPLRPLGAALCSGPSPREGLLNLRKLVQAGVPSERLPAEQPAVSRVASVLCAGPGLGRMLARAPRRLELLLDPTLGRVWTREELARDLDARPEATMAERLSGFRNDQVLRLAACEFGAGRASLEQVGQELSTLADICLDRAMGHAVAALAAEHGEPVTEAGSACGLAAVGMGKYGASELNFCSDIDVVFIYETDRGSAGDLTLHEFFSRVCQRVVRLLDSDAAEGIAFRVDLRLRPEGEQGPICNALGAAERYYETWGGPYDRLAWLKARPAAGDLDLGRAMIEIMLPFVFPRSVRPAVVEQIQQLYRRIGASLSAAHRGWNVKLGAGGIRGVEFFVQALQLLHAGKQPALRVSATLPALDALLFCGFISEREHRQLAEAYELWRRLEHRLQLYDGRQTHLLPERGPVRELITAHLGYTPEELAAEVGRRRAEVEAIYATLGAEPADPNVDPDEPDADGLAALAGATRPDEAEALLAAAGFAQAQRAAEQLGLLAAKPWGPLGQREISSSARLGPTLLKELARSPDPDAALRHVVELSLRFGPYRGLWELLEQNPLTLRLLCNLFGSSDYLARLFIDHPELMDQLLMAGRARSTRSAAELEADLSARLEELDPAGDDPEARLDGLRRFRSEELLRVGLHDVAGALSLEQVWEQLSDLAQAIVAQTFPIVLVEAERRYGRVAGTEPGSAAMAVLALGKLGSRELTYASDLDLIFIHAGDGVTDGRKSIGSAEFFARLAQRLINALGADLPGGRLYEVDTRLRPSGNQGTLVTSWEGFQAYHQSPRSQPWERQVLIKARSVAGDPALGRRVERWVEAYVYGGDPPDPVELAQTMRHHRTRMEKELAAENGAFYNLKLGRGGLLDIDFIVQYLQLCHGGRVEACRARSTLEVLTALSEHGLLDPETATTLVQSYRFLRGIESRLRIVRDRSAERLPASADGLEVMARRLGYRQQARVTPGSALLARYQEVTGAVRGCYERVFGGQG